MSIQENPLTEKADIPSADKLNKIQQEAIKQRDTHQAQKEKEAQELKTKEKMAKHKQILQQVQECEQNAPTLLEATATMQSIHDYNGCIIGNFDIFSDKYEDEKNLLIPLVNNFIEKGHSIFFLRGNRQVYDHQFKEQYKNATTYSMKPNHDNPKQTEQEEGYQIIFQANAESSPKIIWFPSKDAEGQALRSDRLKMIACWR